LSRGSKGLPFLADPLDGCQILERFRDMSVAFGVQMNIETVDGHSVAYVEM
jgi:hypothetical protein